MNLILDIDTQIDFMLKEGNFYIPNAESIIKNLKQVMANWFLPIISIIDEHDENDEEFKTFPKHCIAGKIGATKIPETIVYSSNYIVKGTNWSEEDLLNHKQFIIPKKTYNIWDKNFGNPMAMKCIIEYFNPDTVHVVGVATDICILATVKELSNYVNHIVLHKDCIKGLSKENEDKAIEEMVDLGNVWVE